MIYIIITLLLLCLELIYLAFARELRFTDNSVFAKSTDNTIERHDEYCLRLKGGGIVFLFAIWLWSIYYAFPYPWFITGATLVGTVSFIDDLHPLRISVRLFVQLAAVALMLMQLMLLSGNLSIQISVSSISIYIASIILGTGILNAYNFMDGINGITGAYTLAVLIPLCYLNSSLEFVSTPLLYITGISVIIFCFFNFRRHAVCFAGDVGSITLGFIVLFGIYSIILKTGDFTYLIMISVYGADTALTIIRRIQLKEDLRTSHHRHIYQQLVNTSGFSHLSVATVYALIQLSISIILVLIPEQWHLIYFVIVTVSLVASYYLCLHLLINKNIIIKDVRQSK